MVVELLSEGLVEVALQRCENAGGEARQLTAEEWQLVQAKPRPMRSMRLNLAAAHQVVLELPEGIGGGTGMKLWPASLVLAEWLLSDSGRSAVGGRSVLELGAGAAALPSIAAGLAGAKCVVASDGVSDIVAQARQNVEHNGPLPVTVQLLSWQDAAVGAARRRYEVVLFSDAVYTQRGGFFLADAVQRLVKRTGMVIGAAPPDRGGPWGDFLADMPWRDFDAEEVAIPAEVRAAAVEHFRRDVDSPGVLEDVRETRIWLWRRSRRREVALDTAQEGNDKTPR